MRADARLAEHARALALELGLGRVDVGHLEADMMLPAARVLLEELRDRRSLAQRLDQLDLAVRAYRRSRPARPAPAGRTPNSQIELIEPLGENSPIVKFLEKNPLGGQHHVCFEVPEIHAAKAEFEAKGARVLGEPRIGAHGTPVFFIHPKDMGGLLTEIMETPKAH